MQDFREAQVCKIENIIKRIIRIASNKKYLLATLQRPFSLISHNILQNTKIWFVFSTYGSYHLKRIWVFGH